MSQQIKRLYEFGPFRLDAGERLLLRDGESVPLTPKAFDLLLALVEHHGHLLEKDELMKNVWPDTFVEEANLSYNISLIRKALGEGEKLLASVIVPGVVAFGLYKFSTRPGSSRGLGAARFTRQPLNSLHADGSERQRPSAAGEHPLKFA